MLALARTNHAKSGGAENISFVESQITATTLEAGIADCIISNCVINLVPDSEKPAVFTEMARLLRSGGRIAVSDILAKKPLPRELTESVAAYVGCVAGCSMKETYEQLLLQNGFCGKCRTLGYSASLMLVDVIIVDAQSDLNVYTEAEKSARDCTGVTKASKKPDVPSCCSGTLPNVDSGDVIPWDLADVDINEWAGKFIPCRNSRANERKDRTRFLLSKRS
jgi:arsenite methyltransferase